MSSQTSVPSPGSTVFFRWSALAVAAAGLVQAILGFSALGGVEIEEVHGVIGMATAALALIAIIAAIAWGRRAGEMGLVWHAVAVFVLAVGQVALGEMHVETLHIGVGVLFLVAAVGLGTLALRKTR